MPPLGRLMVRTALVWLLVGFTLGGLVLANKGLGWWPALWRFRASHAHILLVGWMAQFSIGVAFWILPRLPGGSRGREGLVRLGYIALNAGVACGLLYDLLITSLDESLARILPLAAGVLYVVGPNDRHRFRITEDMHSISIFCPPLTGNETVDAQGGYPASVPIEKTDRRMFVKRGSDLRKAGQEMVVANGQARTLRMLTKADGLGFGFSDVHFDKGAEAQLWYKHHWEANHILSGTGEVTDLTTGESWALGPGIAYNVGPKDRHVVKANSDLHYISVFCPPLIGTEQHDKDGALSPSGPVPPGPAGY